tara:strand:- start:67 stop:561 length:495 start_codon:yes stop_codon:yes gene_type:complete
MSYIKSNLDTGEKLKWNARISIKAMILSSIIFYILGILASYFFSDLIIKEVLSVFFKINIGTAGIVILTVLTIIILMTPFYIFTYYSSDFAVSNKRVISKQGIISRNVSEMNLDSIESVNLDQNVFGRLLNFGTIEISGRGTSSVIFLGIDDPVKVRKLVQNKK